jgi:hypothetical protein
MVSLGCWKIEKGNSGGEEEVREGPIKWSFERRCRLLKVKNKKNKISRKRERRSRNKHYEVRCLTFLFFREFASSSSASCY